MTRTHLSTILALAVAAAIAAIAWPKKPPAAPADVALEGNAIVVNGRGLTLQAIAAKLGDPAVLSYDADTRTAIANASFMINGGLTIGRPGDAAFKETLELNTGACGQLNVVVAESGTLAIHHSTLATTSRIVTEEACTRGYTLFCKGRLEVEHSDVTYMSGSYSRTLWGQARARLVDSTFCFNDGNAASFFETDGRRLHIERCTFSSQGNWGIIVRGKRGAPLRLVDCALSGTAGDVLNAGDGAQVHLVDCRFDKNRIRFSQLTGSVAVKWRIKVRTVDAGAGKPLAGVAVRAASAAGTAIRESVESKTGPDGACVLELTEFVARPSAKTRQDGVNNATPHTIAAAGASARIDLKNAGQEVVLRLGAAP